jgi:integrase/recombinase XerC
MSQSANTHIQSFLDYLKFEKRYSQHTIMSYQNDLEQFFAYSKSQFETELINEVKVTMIRSWLAEMKEEKISSKTLNRKISTLKSFFKYLIKQSVVKETPMTTIVSPKVSKRLPQFVSEPDMQDLMQITATSEDWKTMTDCTLIRVFYATGMRLSELINLKISQVDFHYKQLKVLGKGNKERIIPMPSEILNGLKDYIENKENRSPESDHVFVNAKGKPLYAKYVYTTVKTYLGGVTTIEKKSPHVLRHSFATHLMNNGAELNAVKELLGHSSLAATQVYTHNTIEKLKEAFKKAHPKA